MMFKIVNGMTPRYLKDIFQRDQESLYITSENQRMILLYQGPDRTITGRVLRSRGVRSGMHSLIT